MTPAEEALLVSAICSGGETFIRREYGKPWSDEIVTMRELEARGLMKFASCHREPGSQDFIRRSAITEAGMAAVNSAEKV